MRCRAWAEGMPSRTLPPAVGRGFQAEGCKGAFPTRLKCLAEGGTFSRTSSLSCLPFTKCATGGSREGAEGTGKRRPLPTPAENVCYSSDPVVLPARLGCRLWPRVREPWQPGSSARLRTIRRAASHEGGFPGSYRALPCTRGLRARLP